MNVGKKKVSIRKLVEVCDFDLPYRVGVPVAGRCEVVLVYRKWVNGRRWTANKKDEGSEFKGRN